MFGKFFRIKYPLLATAISLATHATSIAIADARPAAGANSNVYITGNGTSQVFLLKDYSGNITSKSLVFKGTSVNITLMNPPNCYGSVDKTIWYFTLPAGKTAQLTNYGNKRIWFALWVPVDSSSTGQLPTTCWFDNYCFGPSTNGAPVTAVPAGATFVELNVANSIYDTVDISEVNGVNAAWSINLPQPWYNNSFRSSKGHLIGVQHIYNNPGGSPNFYGDYGNPGVYPFGCTNCASRYNNQVLRAGCLASEFQPPVSYPGFDVGCDNAVNYYPNNNFPNPTNPPLTTYQQPPPGVAALPYDAYYHSPHGKDTLFNLTLHPPKNPTQKFYGYGICNILRGAAPSGGSIQITLTAYPFGMIQP